MVLAEPVIQRGSSPGNSTETQNAVLQSDINSLSSGSASGVH